MAGATGAVGEVKRMYTLPSHQGRGIGGRILALIEALARDGAPVVLATACGPAIAASAGAVARILESGRPAYGINTGFGRLAQTRIPADELALVEPHLHAEAVQRIGNAARGVRVLTGVAEEDGAMSS